MSTTISITLPDEIKHTLETQVAAGRFRSLGEAIRVGAKLVAQKFTQKYDESWITDDLIKKVKKAQKEPRNPKRVWNGKGSFSEFVLKTK